MAVQYSFITYWQTKAPLAEVWDAIYESEEWPRWWKGVLRVKEIEKGDERGISSVRVYTLRSPTYYKLTFKMLLTDRVDRKLLSGEASGELIGTGAWHFESKDGISYIQCHWNVGTAIPWMNAFAFMLKPIFKWNHKTVMKWGAKSLAKKLGYEVVMTSS